MANPTEDSSSPRLALHADDLGMNRAVTNGILHGFRHGLLTSTSILANAPDVARALEQWKSLETDRAAGSLPSMASRARLGDPNCPFDLGVHLNLTQGQPLGNRYPAALLDAKGHFPGVFALFGRLRRSGDRFHAAILAELEQQVQVVCDHGLRPTHLNGHQYIEMLPAVTAVMPELFEPFGIRVVRVAWERSLLSSTVSCGRFWRWPLACIKRAFAGRFCTRMDALGIAHPDVFFGTAHAGEVDLRLLRLFLTSAQHDRLIEIGLHPGEEADQVPAEKRANGWYDPLAHMRPNELRMLTSADLVAALEATGRRLGRLSQLK
jgi:chitin disaccharide deacetylase